jgi:hypothetical protein
MTSSRASSSSSSEDLAGFRVVRELGRGPRGVVLEAIQTALDRRVALKLLPRDPVLEGRHLEWPTHPNIARLYAVGTSDDHLYLAVQLVEGPRLADLGSRRRRAALAGAAAALDAAHRAGAVHGRIHSGNVLVDANGRGLLTDFGLGPSGATVDDDRSALAELMRASPRRHRRPAAVLAGALAATAAVGGALVGRGGDHERKSAAGATSLGSALRDGDVESVDCAGSSPSGASLLCTIVQTELPGRRLRPTGAGAIRGWSVRGARGTVSLEVLAGSGSALRSVARSAPVQVPDTKVHTFSASLPLRAGQRVGLRVAPGSAIGVRRAPGAATLRALGPAPFSQRRFRAGLDAELMLRVDFALGARVRIPGQLTGVAAERAPAGRSLDTVTVEPRAGLVRTAAVVRLPGAVAVDLSAGGRRLVRLPVPDADPAGRLEAFDTLGEPLARLRWRNPDGAVVAREYAIGAGSLTARG